jgi:D-3-phosphoglycerate dehydrogenase
LRSGYWNKSGGSQLSGKTIGILGVGNVGRDLVRLLQPFGCRVIANDLIDQPDFFEKMQIESMTKNQIYREADAVTLHLPLDDSTRGLVTRDTFEAMKSTAFFINTARGGIVVQDDLKRALRSQAIAGAAIDVYESEPPSDLELLEQENLICTPHVGGNAREAVSNMGNAAIDHVVDFLDRNGVR